MVTYAEILCPRCGAPLPKLAPTGVVHCDYCKTALVPTQGGVRLLAGRPEDLDDPERPRLWAGGRRYVLLGRLARGVSSDVFLARRDHRLGEQVVIKMLRAREDRDRLAHEYDVLQALQRATQRGSEHFTRLMPQPIAHGEGRLGLHGHEGPRVVTVLGFASGFVHTFRDVRAVYPSGVPATAAVWLWKRVLETLAWMHEVGFVHGAILPEHLLVHARDHGVRLVGLSSATAPGRPLSAFPREAEAFYSKATWDGGAASASLDLTMSARSLLFAVGADDGRVPSASPAPLAALLQSVAADDAGGRRDAWALVAELDAAAREAFGPPRYVPFAMPGW